MDLDPDDMIAEKEMKRLAMRRGETEQAARMLPLMRGGSFYAIKRAHGSCLLGSWTHPPQRHIPAGDGVGPRARIYMVKGISAKNGGLKTPSVAGRRSPIGGRWSFLVGRLSLPACRYPLVATRLSLLAGSESVAG